MTNLGKKAEQGQGTGSDGRPVDDGAGTVKPSPIPGPHGHWKLFAMLAILFVLGVILFFLIHRPHNTGGEGNQGSGTVTPGGPGPHGTPGK